MSRNFDLLQTAGRQARLARSDSTRPYAVVEPVSGLEDASDPIMPCERPSTKMSRAARSELVKLAHRLFLITSPEAPRVVVFSGFEQNGGSGRITAVVSEILAGQTQNKVCAVDADFWSPSLHQQFCVANRQGLADAFSEGRGIRRFAGRVSTNLWIVCSGNLPSANGHFPFNPAVTKDVMDDLRANFDYVLISSTSLAKHNDTMMLAQLADGIVFVLESGTTRREIAEKYKEILEAADVRLIGAVLNNRKFPIPQALYERL